jgi:hypothetical protein
MYTEWSTYFTQDYNIPSVNNGISETVSRRQSMKIELLWDVQNFSFNEGLCEAAVVEQYNKLDDRVNQEMLVNNIFETNENDKLADDFFNEDFGVFSQGDNGVKSTNVEDTKTNQTSPGNQDMMKLLDNAFDMSKLKESEFSGVLRKTTSKEDVRDGEIKQLNEKLSSYKHQNKIILEENKKLLEIITIFRELQKIDEMDKKTTPGVGDLKPSEMGISSNKNTLSQDKLFTLEANRSANSLKSSKQSKVSYINTNESNGSGSKKSYGDMYKNKSSYGANQVEKTGVASKPQSFIRIGSNYSSPNNSYYLSSKHSNSNKSEGERLHSNDLIANTVTSVDRISPSDVMSSQQKANRLNENYNNIVFNNYNVDEACRTIKTDNNDDICNFDQIIDLLEHYRDMNDTVIKNLTPEQNDNSVNLNRRKEAVESLEEVLGYINSLQDLQERKNHIIPFYLVDKRKLYENMMGYIFKREETPRVSKSSTLGTRSKFRNTNNIHKLTTK